MSWIDDLEAVPKLGERMSIKPIGDEQLDIADREVVLGGRIPEEGSQHWLALRERMRVAEAEADMLRVIQQHSTPNGLVVGLVQAVLRFIEFTSQYGDFRNGVTSPPDYPNGLDEGDHYFQTEVERVRDALRAVPIALPILVAGTTSALPQTPGGPGDSEPSART